MAEALDFTDKKSVLIVDDTPENLTLMNGLLKDIYKTKIANNGERVEDLVGDEITHLDPLALLGECIELRL